MSEVFDAAFKFTIGEEGKLSLDPNDSGNWTGGVKGIGRLLGTKYGVSARFFPYLDIPNLSLQQAKDIAFANYYHQIDGDNLPPAIALQMFDTAYNQGVHEAKRILQTALGVEVDGVIGPQTLAAAHAEDQEQFADLFAEFRIEAYQRDDNFERYGNGWIARAKACCAAAKELV